MNNRSHDDQLHTSVLTDLGLSQKEAELYRKCIGLSPPVTLEAVLTELPSLEPEIWELTGKLQNRFLLFVASGPSGEDIIEVIDPRIAGRSIATEHLWSVGDIRSEVSRLPGRIDRAYLAATKRFEEIFMPLFVRPTEDEQIEMVPEDKVSEKLAQFIATAKETIRGITAFPWAPRVALVWETLKERMAAGCSYRRISDVETFLCFGYNNNRHDVLSVGVNLRLTPQQPLSKKFYLIDNDAAFIFWPQETSPSFGLDATKTRVTPFVEECQRFFLSTWQSSVPARSIIPLLPGVRRRFVNECYKAGSLIGRDIGSGIFDHGAFYQSTSDGLGSAETEDAVQTLTKAGLIQQSPLGGSSFIPALTMLIREILHDYPVDDDGELG